MPECVCICQLASLNFVQSENVALTIALLMEETPSITLCYLTSTYLLSISPCFAARMGSIEEPARYSVPTEAGEIFRRQVLNNTLLPDLPPEIHEARDLVSFTGNDLPNMPLNWRFAESVAALKAFEASMLNVLRARKFRGCRQSRIEINTDHASIYLLSPFMVKPIDPVTKKPGFLPYDPEVLEAEYKIPNGDVNNALSSFYRLLVTNIYKTKDQRWYHVHGKI